MKLITKLGMAASLTAGAAHAGGVDRSGQDIGFMFEKGGYAALSYGSVRPTVQNVGNDYGDMANDYTSTSLALKTDLNDKLSLGLIMDQPYGADVKYTLLDLGAVLKTQATTAILRYKISDAISIHGGLSYTSVEGTFNPPTGLDPLLEFTINRATDTGYVLGAAWEKPEIAARVALSYFSSSDLVDVNPLSTLYNSSFNTPQAVNLDFQTGVAANTLEFGSVRWADWSNTVIKVFGSEVVSYDNDSLTYSLGIGRKFNDNWSAAVTLGYEAAQGGIASALAPTDGSKSIGLGVTYTMENVKISGGVRFVALGDATTDLAVRFSNEWQGNTASAAGVKIAYTF